MNKQHENKQKKVFHAMKVNKEKAIEVNSKLKINVDEQHVDMKHLKDKCEIDDEDEGQQITAPRTPMKKNEPVCVTCNQTFGMQNWSKNLSRKSTLSCGEIIVAKCLEIEIKQTISFLKHVNQPVMNAEQKMRLKMAKHTVLNVEEQKYDKNI